MSRAPFELNSHIVRAGAGAGKTTRLTAHVLNVVHHFLEQEKRVPRIVVTTFTRKATQELRERLMAQAVVSGQEPLVRFAATRDNLLISTIHGVLHVFLSRFGVRLGLDPVFQIITSSDLARMARQVLREKLLQSEQMSSLLEVYSFQQILDFCLEMQEWSGYLDGLRPFALEDFETLFEQIIGDISERSANLASEIQAESTDKTWLRVADVLHLGRNKSRNIDCHQAREIWLGVLDEIGRKPSYRVDRPAVSKRVDDNLSALLGDLKALRKPDYDRVNWMKFVESWDLFNQLAQEFAADFKTLQKKSGKLSLSDLELVALDLIRKDPHVAESFSREWDYWLIDEYQDTSPIQAEILRALVGSSHHFVVGDPQQSIYLFRGARREVFFDKQTDIQRARGQAEELRRNYRSIPSLLLFFNELFTGMSDEFYAMEPKKDGDEIQTVATIAKGERTESGERDELKAIVQHVQDLVSQGAKPESICVLSRTNRNLITVAQALNQYGLRTHVHVASGFYERREIHDALNVLKFLLNPHDDINLMELLRSPWFCVDDNTLADAARGRSSSLWLTLLSRHADQHVIQQLCESLERVRSNGIAREFQHLLTTRGFFDFCSFQDSSGRREANLWKLVVSFETEHRQPGFNSLEFIRKRADFDQGTSGEGEGDAVSAVEPNRINLMTVHGAKGLEFDHVILPMMHQAPRTTKGAGFVLSEENRRWALPLPDEDEQKMHNCLLAQKEISAQRQLELQESLRVFYVAVTRAKKSVFMSWSGDPKAESWASQIKLDLGVGLHECQGFRYQVTQGPWNPQSAEKTHAEEDIAVRPRFESHEASEPSKAKSVSNIVAEASRTSEASQDNRHRILARLRSSADGVWAHRIFEFMRYHSGTQLRDVITRGFAGRELEVAEALNFVRDLHEPPFLELMQSGEVEWGFLYSHRGMKIEGQIDLWGKSPDSDKQLWIVDYKTGSHTDLDRSFFQLNLYALALRGSGCCQPNDHIRLAVVNPFKKLVKIQPALSTPEIDRRILSQTET